jgi:hypothetical protein
VTADHHDRIEVEGWSRATNLEPAAAMTRHVLAEWPDTAAILGG